MSKPIASDETILASAPAGSRVIRSPRFTDPLRNFMQTACALFFASYFFFAPIMAGILFAFSYCGVCSNFTIGCILALYFLQLALYRPHNYRGWPALLLYSKLTDFVLHYYDGVCLREVRLMRQLISRHPNLYAAGTCTRSKREIHVRLLPTWRLWGAIRLVQHYLTELLPYRFVAPSAEGPETGASCTPGSQVGGEALAWHFTFQG